MLRIIEHRELYVKRTAWVGNCSSWFRRGTDGELFSLDSDSTDFSRRSVTPMLFPGNRILFIELLNNMRWEDWEYEYGYAGNRFGYLGNGFTQREKDGRGELTHFEQTKRRG